MGDRTNFQVQVLGCPREERAVFFDLVDDLDLADDWCPPWPRGPVERIYLAQDYVAHETSCGVVDEWATRLAESAPNAVWSAWEDPAYEWLGNYACHVPGLGLWVTECDANGAATYTSAEVRALAGTRDLERLLGTPWLDALDDARAGFTPPAGGPAPRPFLARPEGR